MNSRQGFSLLEGLIASALIVVMMTAVMGEVIQGQRANIHANNLNQAYKLAAEGLEAVRDIKMDDFSILEEGSYGLATTDDGQWQLIKDQSEIIDNFFTREIYICPGGEYEELCVGYDPDIWRVQVSVSWEDKPPVVLVTEFMNWIPTFENWSNIEYSGSFDLTAANSGSNNHKIRALKVWGSYLLVGNDNSAGKEFIVFNIREAPTLTIEGTLDLDGDPRAIAIYQNAVYIASDSQTQELQVIDVSNPSSPVLVNSIDLSGNNDGLSIDVNSDSELLVLGRVGGKLYIFDISLPEEPPQLMGSLDLGEDVNDLKIRDSVVFAALDNGSLAAVDISVPSMPILLSELFLSSEGCGEALSLDVSDTRFYVGCNGDSSYPELFIGNANDPSNMSVIEYVDVGGGGADVKYIKFLLTPALYDPGNFSEILFLLTGDTTKEFQVWEVTWDMPSRWAYLNMLGSASDADYSPLAQKVFVGFLSNPEIQIIAPNLIYNTY